MDNMEEKIGSILGNPQMMQQIISMAQNLAQAQPQPEPPSPAMPEMDPAMMGKLMNLAGNAGPDRNQQTLLKALDPYLASGRIQKLEKAMRAAKLAGLASTFLNGNLMTGR